MRYLFSSPSAISRRTVKPHANRLKIDHPPQPSPPGTRVSSPARPTSEATFRA